jgi:hypothetical protein
MAADGDEDARYHHDDKAAERDVVVHPQASAPGLAIPGPAKDTEPDDDCLPVSPSSPSPIPLLAAHVR